MTIKTAKENNLFVFFLKISIITLTLMYILIVFDIVEVDKVNMLIIYSLIITTISFVHINQHFNLNKRLKETKLEVSHKSCNLYIPREY